VPKEKVAESFKKKSQQQLQKDNGGKKGRSAIPGNSGCVRAIPAGPAASRIDFDQARPPGMMMAMAMEMKMEMEVS
jgi:hypothetical protein